MEIKCIKIYIKPYIRVHFNAQYLFYIDHSLYHLLSPSEEWFVIILKHLGNLIAVE